MKRTLITLALFLSTTCKRDAAPERSPAEQLLASALIETDATKRRELVEQALRLSPNFLEAVIELAETCRYWLRDEVCAEAQYRRALALDPVNANVLQRMGHLLIEQGNRPDNARAPAILGEAKALAVRRLQVEPTCDARDQLVSVHQALHDRGAEATELLTFLTESLAACRDDVARQKYWLAALGYLHEEAGRLAEAEQSYCDAVRLGSDLAAHPCLVLRARRSLGGAAAKEEPAGRAIDAYRPANDDWLGHYLLGLYQGDIQHFEIAARHNPKFRPAAKHMAELHHQAGKVTEACRALEHAYRLALEEAGESNFEQAYASGEYEVYRNSYGCTFSPD